MKKKANELEFISIINRDGSGTEIIKEDHITKQDAEYDLHCLSVRHKTYIALNFNAFVVRIKEQKIHELKTLPQYFNEVFNGNKTFELRKDDRNYNVGDTLKLREFDGAYTGRQCSRIISYILKDAEQYGLKEGFVIIGMK